MRGIFTYRRGYWSRAQLKAIRRGLLLRSAGPSLLRDTAARVIQRHVRGLLGRTQVGWMLTCIGLSLKQAAYLALAPQARENRRAIIDIQRWWKVGRIHVQCEGCFE